jgi:hypothetical protein
MERKSRYAPVFAMVLTLGCSPTMQTAAAPDGVGAASLSSYQGWMVLSYANGSQDGAINVFVSAAGMILLQQHRPFSSVAQVQSTLSPRDYMALVAAVAAAPVDYSSAQFAAPVDTGFFGYVGPAAVDIDHDGNTDLVASGGAAHDVVIALNDGSGRFRPFALHDTCGLKACYPDAGPFAAGDLDGDGLPELVVGGVAPADPWVYSWRNQSTPGAPSFATGSSAFHFQVLALPTVAIGDLNGDGRNDLAVTYPPSGGGPSASPRTLGYVQGATGFAQGQNLSLPFGQVIADVDGDGLPDLLAVDRNLVAIALNRTAPGGMTTFAAPTWFDAGFSFTAVDSLTVGDVDGDGMPDVIVAISQTLLVLHNSGHVGAPAFAKRYGGQAPVPTQSRVPEALQLAVADFDHDGKLDLVAMGSEYLTAQLFRGR